jgi:dTDP-4-dehydrorhamnose reductase
MKVLITGTSGLVGSHTKDYLQKENYSLITPSSKELNITDKKATETFINSQKPDVLIHFAAYTDVSAAENDRNNKDGIVWNVNVNATHNLIENAKKNNIFLIYISTEYVFSGRAEDKGPYKEDHPLETDSSKVTWYGYTKGISEAEIRASLTDYAIVRITNPIRAIFPQKADHMQKIIQAFDAGKTLKMFNDQYTTLTYINEISEAMSKILSLHKKGTYHISSQDIMTPYDFANYVLKKTRNVENVVQPSSLTEFLKTFNNPSRYPQYAGLDISRSYQELGLNPRTWHKIIDDIVDEGLA